MKTLAIVVGNNEYYEGFKLANAENDAKAVAEVFAEFNYDVKLYLNLDKKMLIELLEFYSSNLKNYDASIFYFAGHGFEVDGHNFLASIESQIPPINKYAAKQDCILLEDLFSIYRENPSKLNIVILDACRKSFDRGNVLGFSPLFTPKGSLIAFSTSPNEGASDLGYENNSIYTGSFLSHLKSGRIGVEDLFKAVRKSVFALSDGKQTTWEHTSLIGDFYFFKEQPLDILSLPYHNNVIKDEHYYEDSDFYKKIEKVKIRNWYVQNPEITNLLAIPKSSLTEDQMFILGRNLLQSAHGSASNAVDFFTYLKRNLLEFQLGNQNHVLNGILFEMYYDSKGEFRFHKCKGDFREQIFQLSENLAFANSFRFIKDILLKQNYKLIFIPGDIKIDITVKATVRTRENFGREEEIQHIEAIVYDNIDITKEILGYYISPLNETGLKAVISKHLNSPLSIVNINSNVELKKIAYGISF